MTKRYGFPRQIELNECFCGIHIHTLWGICSNYLICTGLKLQNFERPINSHLISSWKRWYATFNDISMYLTWIVVFEVFPLLRTSSEITLSFLSGACHDMSSFLKNFWTASVYSGLMPVQTFQCIPFTSRPGSSAIFAITNHFFLGEWGKDLATHFIAFPVDCFIW